MALIEKICTDIHKLSSVSIEEESTCYWNFKCKVIWWNVK